MPPLPASPPPALLPPAPAPPVPPVVLTPALVLAPASELVTGPPPLLLAKPAPPPPFPASPLDVTLLVVPPPFVPVVPTALLPAPLVVTPRLPGFELLSSPHATDHTNENPATTAPVLRIFFTMLLPFEPRRLSPAEPMAPRQASFEPVARRFAAAVAELGGTDAECCPATMERASAETHSLAVAMLVVGVATAPACREAREQYQAKTPSGSNADVAASEPAKPVPSSAPDSTASAKPSRAEVEPQGKPGGEPLPPGLFTPGCVRTDEGEAWCWGPEPTRGVPTPFTPQAVTSGALRFEAEQVELDEKTLAPKQLFEVHGLPKH